MVSVESPTPGAESGAPQGDCADAAGRAPTGGVSRQETAVEGAAGAVPAGQSQAGGPESQRSPTAGNRASVARLWDGYGARILAGRQGAREARRRSWWRGTLVGLRYAPASLRPSPAAGKDNNNEGDILSRVNMGTFLLSFVTWRVGSLPLGSSRGIRLSAGAGRFRFLRSCCCGGWEKRLPIEQV